MHTDTDHAVVCLTCYALDGRMPPPGPLPTAPGCPTLLGLPPARRQYPAAA